jgi:hypothetical protein
MQALEGEPDFDARQEETNVQVRRYDKESRRKEDSYI